MASRIHSKKTHKHANEHSLGGTDSIQPEEGPLAAPLADSAVLEEGSDIDTLLDRTSDAQAASSEAVATDPEPHRVRMLRGIKETEPVKRAQSAPALHFDWPAGNLDRLDHDEILGWAWDGIHPDEPIDIDILDNDAVLLKVRADQFRSDLLTAGLGNGNHGFAVRGHSGLLSLSLHQVRVCRSTDGVDIPGSPRLLSRPVLDSRAVDFFERVVSSAILVAKTPNDLVEPLDCILRLLNELVNASDTLGRTIGSERHGSSILETAAGAGLTDRMLELVDQLRLNHAPIHLELADGPTVSVIIPVHNKFSYTYNCLQSIQRALPKRSFEVIIVDDCSDDETLLSALVFGGSVRILRNASNLGFVRSCNTGAAAAKGRYLFFLNNDTLVKEGWLDELVETFEHVPNIGIAGAKLLFSDGKLQEAGGIIWRLGDGWNWGRGREAAEPEFSFMRDADWVSGAALMIERETFRQRNGFDELYAPAYYEDTDLAFRVRELGKRVVVQPASEIVHLEGVSAGTDPSGTGMKRYQVINHAKFYQRWKDTLLSHRFNGQLPEVEAERRVTRRAYFIDDSVPSPDQDAGSNAAIQHMRTLMDLGYKVTFLPADNMAKIDPYTGQLQKLGVECWYHPYRGSVEEVFRKASKAPDLVYLHRFTNASKYALMVKRYFPDCRIVYCVADLHFLRMQRQADVEPRSISLAQVMQQRRNELLAMQSVDCVIVHSPFEAGQLRELDPTLRVQIVPWTVLTRPATLPFSRRFGTAFVGGFAHPPNVDAVCHLVKEILPSLRSLVPDYVTYIVGSKMPNEIANLEAPGLRCIGFVSELADILHKLRCTVAPLR
jgi:O-antigen biosynthesis protein